MVLLTRDTNGVSRKPSRLVSELSAMRTENQFPCFFENHRPAPLLEVRQTQIRYRRS